MTNEDARKIIRYAFIFITYNFLLSVIAYVVDWINDVFFGYSMSNWDFMSFWLFISVCVLIAGFMLYMAPFFERALKYSLEEKMDNVAKKRKVDDR